MITVLIPTFNRPHLLRVALQSVAKQTYLHYIDKIIVSENGLNEDSKIVCEEFSNLNVVYVYQQTQLVVLDHLKWLMKQGSSKYVAFLCDDDWWNLFHIELAVKGLRQFPECIAHFSNFVRSNSEDKIEFVSYEGAKFLAMGFSHINNYDLIKLDAAKVFLTSFIVTPFHFSSLVCQNEILAQVSSILDEVHPTYSDRALWAMLSTYGDLVFNPLETVIIRNHSNQDSHNYSSSTWRNENQNGSLYILSKADIYGISIKDRINDIYLKGNFKDRADLTEQLDRVFVDRNYVSWYEGYNKILALDKQRMCLVKKEKSYKTILGRKVLNVFRNYF